MKKRIVVAFLFVLTVSALALFLTMSIKTQPIVKTAVKERNLPKDEPFIICEQVAVTGFGWQIISDRGIGEKGTYCNIVGPTPLNSNLKVDFLISKNKYVFYITDVQEYYSNELNENVIEYTATGWDILYPVRRESMITFLKTPKYILECDLVSTNGQ